MILDSIMVRTRRSAAVSDPQSKDEENKYSIEDLAAIAGNVLNEKLKEKRERGLPDILPLQLDDYSDDDGEKITVDNLKERQRKYKKLATSIDVDEIAEGIGSSRRSLSVDPLNELMKKSIITPDLEKMECIKPIHISRRKALKLKKEEKEKTAGNGWFNMPRPEMTEQLTADLKIIQMRNTLDKSHHYKSTDWKKLPKYFQVGTVIEGPGEYYSSRIPKKDRKKTLVEELLADDKFKK
jgi:hypothetical protein